MNIYIEDTGKAYLPELYAYKKYFESHEIINLTTSSECQISNNFDFIWKFMGMSIAKSKVPEIHEYHSLSTGRIKNTKNKIKRLFNCKPVLRIFLNDLLENKMGFNDGVKSVTRPMGIDESFFNVNREKKYDFLYCGSITKSRGIESLLDLFKDNNNYSLLLVGYASEKLKKKFSMCNNITFLGRVPYNEVSNYASQATFGINYIPNIFPYNVQDSTKFLEYHALGLKVITTKYKWVIDFQNKHNGKYFYINDDLRLFDFDKINTFSYFNPSVNDFSWYNIISNSRLEEALLELIK